MLYSDDLPTSQWRKSSYSGGGNDCVEVTFNPVATGLRDSKDVTVGALWLRARTWQGLRQATARTG